MLPAIAVLGPLRRQGQHVVGGLLSSIGTDPALISCGNVNVKTR